MRAYVGVGTNLGDRWGHLSHAARAIQAEPRLALVRASRVWDAAPLGPPQPRYLNAVLELECDAPAQTLLSILQLIELAEGRRRPAPRWSARTLDLDVLLYGDDVIRTPTLVVPHPGIVVRRFVLAPLAELCADRVVPCTGQPVSRLLAHAPAADLAPAGLYPT